MKKVVFWVVAPCILVQVTDVSEVCTVSIRAIMMGPDDGGSTDLRNVGPYQGMQYYNPEDRRLHMIDFELVTFQSEVTMNVLLKSTEK
jgi:hypothetical protein